ncbi:MAG: preprotein translocase subunit SecY [Clostridia bacterium]|nr:preprotein translocase subunit SecY [Clostridia bacterium]
MFKTLINAFKMPDLRKKLLFTLFMLIVFQLGTVVPVPGIQKDALKELLGIGDASGSLFNLVNILSGNAMQNASIFAMSITPYVNSSIIMQLLAVAIPALERLSKEGEEGRKVIAKWTRYGTVILAFIQAAGLYISLNNSGALELTGLIGFITITLSFTAGTAFLMWIGEQITEKGIGNGISVIIFAGIVTSGPQLIASFWVQLQTNWIIAVLMLILCLAVVVFVVMINDAERRIPVQYAKRVVGRKMYGGQNSHIPFKVSMEGVIPIIFASSILSFPATIARLFSTNQPAWITNFMTSPLYAILYFLLIIFFTFFYTAMMYNPIEMANNIKGNGGFIPGIRPGKPTSDYITKTMNKVTVIGSVAIALIAVLPILMSQGNISVSFGGTSLLILVGVAIETYRQLESQMIMRNYKGFLD